jgi:hypothetical protein
VPANRKLWNAAEKVLRERQKQLWLKPLLDDLRTPGALETAKQFSISLRLVGQIAGLIVNLDSFLDDGYVYPSQAGLGKRIKNENGQSTSARQIRRAIGFLIARDHLHVEHCRGTRNKMFPRYRRAETNAGQSEDMVAADRGHDVRRVRTSCPPNLNTKLDIKHNPPTPQTEYGENVVKLADQRPSRETLLDEGPSALENVTFDQFYAACVKRERDPRGPALAKWNKLAEVDRQAIADLVHRDGRIDLSEVYVCTWIDGRQWETRFDPPSGGKVFVEEDTEGWAAWSAHYRKHGGPNGMRVAPWAFDLADGRRGGFFPSARPPAYD